jgi:hypothetical protein
MTIVLIGSALITLISRQPKLSLEVSFFCIAVLLTFIIIGEVLTFSTIGARKWHAEYVNCLIILQKVIFSDNLQINSDFILPKKREPFYGSFLTSRSFIIAQVALFIVFVLSGIFIMAVSGIGFWSYLLVLNISVLVFLLNRHFAITILNKAESEFWADPLRCWCLSGLEHNNQERSRNNNV